MNNEENEMTPEKLFESAKRAYDQFLDDERKRKAAEAPEVLRYFEKVFPCLEFSERSGYYSIGNLKFNMERKRREYPNDDEFFLIPVASYTGQLKMKIDDLESLGRYIATLYPFGVNGSLGFAKSLVN